jgi:hypothetical protein
MRILLSFAAIIIATGASAQNSTTNGQGPWNPDEVLRKEGWVKPPAVVERIIMATRPDISYTTPSPDRKWFVRTAMADRGDIKDYGKPHIYLAGLAVDTKANRARQMTMRAGTALTLVDPRTNATKSLEVPKGATVSSRPESRRRLRARRCWRRSRTELTGARTARRSR